MVNGATDVQSAFCSILSLHRVHRVLAMPSPIEINDLRTISNTLYFVVKSCLGVRTSVTLFSIMAFCSL